MLSYQRFARLAVGSLVIALQLGSTTRAIPQSSATRIPGVSEPPELTGEPKKVSTPTEADRQLFEIIGHLKDADETKSTLPKLDEFIKQHPDYSDAYFLRATCQACLLNSRDYASISNDVEAAMSLSGQTIYNKTDYYSLLGKIGLATSQYDQAMDSLEKAMTRDLDSADKMFNIEGVEPEKTSKFCIWNLTDLDKLVAKFPDDYRAWLFRGLYYEFFTTFKEVYYAKAMLQFQRAAVLNASSPLPQYFIGELYAKASFWSAKAVASDENRDEIIKNGLLAFSKAIQLDSKFLPAYEHRASSYLNLKQYRQAIRDFDKVLELDSETAAAYSDRGVAKLELGQYLAATFDFRDAIQRKDPGDSFLSNLYEYRGEANFKLGYYREAIADYSKAIERRLANDIFLMSLKQFRALYPEYDGVSDETICRKLNILLFPNFEYKMFAKQLMEENGRWQISFLLVELYEKRGDTYLKAGDYRRGVLDFQRIFKGIPNFAKSTDRWRELGTNGVGEKYYLDAKSFEFADGGRASLWVKTMGKKQTQTVAYEIDCKMRRMNGTSITVYDSNDKVVSSSESSSGWQSIVPDTVGEQLYIGTCSTAH